MKCKVIGTKKYKKYYLRYDCDLSSRKDIIDTLNKNNIKWKTVRDYHYYYWIDVYEYTIIDVDNINCNNIKPLLILDYNKNIKQYDIKINKNTSNIKYLTYMNPIIDRLLIKSEEIELLKFKCDKIPNYIKYNNKDCRVIKEVYVPKEDCYYLYSNYEEYIYTNDYEKVDNIIKNINNYIEEYENKIKEEDIVDTKDEDIKTIMDETELSSFQKIINKLKIFSKK